MKKIVFYMVLVLMVFPQAVAQGYKYVPFVREGVKWVYICNNPFMDYVLDMPSGIQYYSFEMLPDVMVGNKYYKPLRLTHYLNETGNEKEIEDFVPVYLREENKVVYAIHPDGILHAQCPVGFFGCISDSYDLPLTTTDEEFVLYDFNDPIAFYDGNIPCEVANPLVELTGTDTITVGNHKSKCHHFHSEYTDGGKIIEGIGYDGFAGMPLFYFKLFITGLQVGYGLSHVIEDGKIIYKGQYYDPEIMSAINEIATDDKCQADGNYYNLMGQPLGVEVPTTSGIYIHNGKKIVVR